MCYILQHIRVSFSKIHKVYTGVTKSLLLLLTKYIIDSVDGIGRTNGTCITPWYFLVHSILDVH